MSQPKTQTENRIFAIHYKGQLLGSFKWNNSSAASSGLYGWRPPKKIYWKLGLARSGATHLPKEILDDCEIVEYAPVKTVEKLSTSAAQKTKQINKLKKTIRHHRNMINWRGARLNPDLKQWELLKLQDEISEEEKKLAAAQKELEDLK